MKQQRAEMTRAELRHDWYRVAQQVRFDAETKLNQRLEEELKTTEEFNSMQLKLRKLLASKVTMVGVAGFLNLSWSPLSSTNPS